jgi:hypothetical protein
VLASDRLGQVLTQKPAQLKPLDRDAIRLVPKLVQNAPNTTASLARDGRSLVLDIDVGSKVRWCSCWRAWRTCSSRTRSNRPGDGAA